VTREWADFCRETREILSMLITRIDREERTLLPLLNRNLGTAATVRRAVG
jgi:hypothetical protein